MKRLIYSRGGSFCFLLISFCAIVCLNLVPVQLHAVERNPSIRLLYFFNTSCRHCGSIKSFIIELSKEYPVEGWILSKQDVGDYPFPVRVGSREIATKYNVYGVPSLVVLKKERFVQLVPGDKKIENVRPLLSAFKAGAMNVTEALQKKPGDEAFVTGFVKIEGKDMKNAKVFIVDHARKLPVDPWLPLEAVKSKFRKTPPRLLSEVAGKAVALKGMLVSGPDRTLRLQVKEEIRYDQDLGKSDTVLPK